jgi:hypothetical protein
MAAAREDERRAERLHDLVARDGSPGTIGGEAEE